MIVGSDGEIVRRGFTPDERLNQVVGFLFVNRVADVDLLVELFTSQTRRGAGRVKHHGYVRSFVSKRLLKQAEQGEPRLPEPPGTDLSADGPERVQQVVAVNQIVHARPPEARSARLLQYCSPFGKKHVEARTMGMTPDDR